MKDIFHPNFCVKGFLIIFILDSPLLKIQDSRFKIQNSKFNPLYPPLIRGK